MWTRIHGRRSLIRSFLLLSLACLLCPLFANAECEKQQDHRSNKSRGIVVADFKIAGTGKIGSVELSKIVNTFTGSCFNDDSEELEERVRAAFQQRGYFLAEVKNLRTKPLDVLASPKPVDLEAEVAEGRRHRLADIELTGNSSFSGKRLRRQFPLRTGDVFDRDKIASGLEALRRLYASQGYIDCTFVPNTRLLSDAKVDLIVSVEEGKHYRMGTLYIRRRRSFRTDSGRIGNWLKDAPSTGPTLPSLLTRTALCCRRTSPRKETRKCSAIAMTLKFKWSCKSISPHPHPLSPPISAATKPTTTNGK